MIKEKSTYSLDIIVNTLCKKVEEVDFIKSVLSETLAIYQWHYQNASDKQQRDLKASAKSAVEKTIKLLYDIGQDTLAEDVRNILVDETILKKSNILTEAKRHMKDKILAGYKLKEKMQKIEIDYKKDEMSKEEFKKKKQQIDNYFRDFPYYGITESKYNNKYTTLLSEAFKEWCKKYPLKHAPEHFDMYFEPFI